MLSLFCFLGTLVTSANGAAGGSPREYERYFVIQNMLYRSHRDYYIDDIPPIGCLCRKTKWLRKTGYKKRCSKAYDFKGTKIQYLKIDDGACNIGEKKFFSCTAAGLHPLGCCKTQDGNYIPADGAEYYYENKTTTCAVDTFKLHQQPLGTMKEDQLLRPISFSDKQEVDSIEEQIPPQRPNSIASSRSSSSDGQ